MPPDVQPAGGESAKAPRSAGRLGPGSELGGGRYTIDAMVYRSPFGEVYRGRDTGAGQKVLIHLLDPEPAADAAAMKALKASIDAVQALEHDGIARVVELASEDAATYVVTERPDGHTLRELLARKQETGNPGFSPRGAHNILVQVVAALTAAHPSYAHGTLSLDSIVVSKAGRVRLTNFGLAALAPAAAAAGRLGPSVAPEVASSGRAEPASDTYSAGAILYEILVGAPPVKGCRRPSQAIPGMSAAVDQLVARCMAREPAKRPTQLAQIKKAMATALSSSGTHQAQSGSQPAQAPAQRAAPPSGRPSLAQAITAPSPSAAQAAADPGGALSAALSDDEERWLVSKGKLDYGPFTLAQVVEQIQANQVLPGHTVVDNHTGERQPVEDHPLLTELVEEARHRRDEQRRAKAEVAVAKQEKRRGAALYVFITAGVLALGGGAWYTVDKLSSDDGGESAGVASLEEGSVAISPSSVKAEQKKRRGRRGGGRSRGGGGGNQGAAGWNDPMDLGDVSEGGESERLSDAQINPVLQRHGGRLGQCLIKNGGGSAHIRFIIKGSGRVSWVSVNGKTKSGLAGCVRRAMKGMKFPSFDGPRTRATFDMSL